MKNIATDNRLPQQQESGYHRYWKIKTQEKKLQNGCGLMLNKKIGKGMKNITAVPILINSSCLLTAAYGIKKLEQKQK